MTTPIPVQATVEPGSRLEGLLAAYAELKPAADEAAARLKTVADALKVELTARHPGAPQVEVAHEALAAPLRLTYVESWRLDTKRLKAENPETYVRYATKGGSWQLRAVAG